MTLITSSCLDKDMNWGPCKMYPNMKRTSRENSYNLVLSKQVYKTEGVKENKFWTPDSTHPPIALGTPKGDCLQKKESLLEFWTGFDPS